VFSVGWTKFFAEYGGPHSADFSLLPGSDATLAVVLGWIGLWATGLFGNLPGQDLQQRMFSAKSAVTARNACILSGVMYLMFGLIPVGLGLMSRLELPVDTTFVQVKVLMYMAGKNLSVPLAVIFVVSFVSIVMSTACSSVLAPATILGHNFLGKIKAFQHNKLLLERVCVLLVSLGGLSLAYWGKSVIGLLDLSLSLQLVGLFVPLTMGLYGRPRGELAAVLATVLGCLFFAARYAPQEIIFTMPETLAARGTTHSRFDERRSELRALQVAYEQSEGDEARKTAHDALAA
jgi:Na+/proline symporter